MRQFLLLVVVGLIFVMANTAFANDWITDFAVLHHSSQQHIIDHTPSFSWALAEGVNQTMFEIEIGTDNDWTLAEMWDPNGSVGSQDTINYYGDTLVDGQTYFARLRIDNDTAWSNWFEISFRMNSNPTRPVLLHPNDREITGQRPAFWLMNSTDADGDELIYDFLIGFDSICSCQMATNAFGVSQTIDSTGWTSEEDLGENNLLYWRASAHDGYERSIWAPSEAFWINEVEDDPTPFDIYYPPDTDWAQVTEFPADFWWGTSQDKDPFDSVYYRLLISTDSVFSAPTIYDSIYHGPFLAAPLEYNTHYWWKVYAIDTKGNMTESNNVADFMTWVLGDANYDYRLNIGDAIFLINYIFKGGYPPYPNKRGDVNLDCRVNLADAVYIINYIFKSGPAPGVGCTE